ncbi:MAG TPA: cytochrome ubiquinol oxidase subunit I [Frankiaceae bacterium]|nr:cytochrome ubiquinol oxidase subunit I [Frankiaceae bacterium]
MEVLAFEPDLFSARMQMALSLGWHIVIACFGVGFPVLVLIAEWRAHRTGDMTYDTLARRWAKALAVLFAVGAVSGTILSFELGILWPGLMGRFGEVIGLPFAIEGIAFFVEAIFLGIYLYGWDRLPRRVHLLCGVPVVLGGLASAWFVVTANAWMNQPTGFRLEGTRVVDPDPVAAMFNPATPVETTHMILAAYLVSGFGVASVYAWSWLRGRRDRYTRLGFLVSFTFAAVFTIPQVVVGDWAARFLAERQPVKLAAIEGLERTQRGAPLTVGGVIEIPKGLSVLAHHDPNAEVIGLDSVPPEDRPPVLPVRIAFQVMVAIGTGFVVLTIWYAFAWWRRRDLPRSRLFMVAALLAGPGAAVALEAGWIVTEVGRQPWIVYGVMRTSEAVTSAPGIRYGYYALIVIYTALTVATVYVLRRLAALPREPHVDPAAAEPMT